MDKEIFFPSVGLYYKQPFPISKRKKEKSDECLPILCINHLINTILYNINHIPSCAQSYDETVFY